MDIKLELTKHPKAKVKDETKLGFGRIFTDHMFVMDYEEGKGWHNARIEEYGPIELDPSTMVLHYGQTIFEGLKAYRCADGHIQLFRVRDNYQRMNRSAQRLCIPAIDVDFCVEATEKLVRLEKEWVPSAPNTSLYIRPFIIATDPYLGVSVSKTYKFIIVLSPVGAYYATGLKPVTIYVEDEYVRACRGGTGFAKTAANYAASLIAGDIAHQKGFAQVLWLDAFEHKYVEEVGSMNIMFLINDTVVTPPLAGSILPGITRDSIIKIARSKGYQVEERPISMDEIEERLVDGSLKEVFGTGTAAVISPVGALYYKEKLFPVNGGVEGKFAHELYDTLTGIQYGRKADDFGWITKLD